VKFVNFNKSALNHNNFIIINPYKQIPRTDLTISIAQSAFAVESIVLDGSNWNVHKLLSVLSVMSAECAECTECTECAECIECIQCTECTECSEHTKCIDCTECAGCIECTECTEC
jgi:hypothetical protein